MENSVPVRLFHAHDEFVRRDARVVDEDVDFPEILYDLIDRHLGCGKIGNVALIIARGNARRRKCVQRFLCRRLFAVIDNGDVCMFCREGERDLRADPPARARDERHSVFCHIRPFCNKKIIFV